MVYSMFPGVDPPGQLAQIGKVKPEIELTPQKISSGWMEMEPEMDLEMEFTPDN